jgi:hypothetical protein
MDISASAWRNNAPTARVALQDFAGHGEGGLRQPAGSRRIGDPEVRQISHCLGAALLGASGKQGEARRYDKPSHGCTPY